MKPLETELTELPQEVHDALYPAVGSLIIYWSLLEQSIESWVHLIYHHPGGNMGWEKTFPFVFRRKVTFLRMRFSDFPAIDTLASDGLALLAEIEAAATKRDIFVHGALSGYEPATQRIKFVRLRVDKVNLIHQMNPDYVTIPQVLADGRIMLALTTASLGFAQRLADHLMGQDGDDAPSDGV